MRNARRARDVAIIGAGPAGIQAALRLKELDLEPVVFEEHATVGVHKLCAGLLSRAGVEDLGLQLGDSVQNEVRGARLFSPNGTMLQVQRPDTVAYVVDRKDFDHALLKRARLMGIPVCTKARLVDTDGDAALLRIEGRDVRWRAAALVGADGARSVTRKLAGLEPHAYGIVHSAQALCSGAFDPGFVEVHLGSFARGFFGWVIPMSRDRAKIGLGSAGAEGCAEALRTFIHRRFPGVTPQRLVSGAIPFGPPLPAVQAGNTALVGDAAYHTKATSGGGIIFGMKAANTLAECIAGMHGQEAPLRSYERRLASINHELRMHWKIRSWFNSLSEREVDELFTALKRRGVEEFLAEEGNMDTPSTFIGKLAVRPTFWFMARTLAAIVFA